MGLWDLRQKSFTSLPTQSSLLGMPRIGPSADITVAVPLIYMPFSQDFREKGGVSVCVGCGCVRAHTLGRAGIIPKWDLLANLRGSVALLPLLYAVLACFACPLRTHSGYLPRGNDQMQTS